LPLTLKFGRSHWSASWFMTVLTAAGVALFIALGRWQWHRADEKRALATQFAAGAGAIVDLDRHPAGVLPRYAQVRARGRYDGAHQFLLDNMSDQGAPGYEVLTPLELADGRTVMVNRGWVPLSISRQHLPDVGLSSSEVHTGVQTVVGKLDNLPVAGIALGHLAPAAGPRWPKLTSFPTMTDLSAALGRPLQPSQLLLNADQPLGYVRDWWPTGFGPERNLSYAFQWWGFAALALVLYGALNRDKAQR